MYITQCSVKETGAVVLKKKKMIVLMTCRWMPKSKKKD